MFSCLTSHLFPGSGLSPHDDWLEIHRDLCILTASPASLHSEVSGLRGQADTKRRADPEVEV